MVVCPVCKTNCPDSAGACSLCGFTELYVEFINKDEADYWLEHTLKPYREKWNRTVEEQRQAQEAARQAEERRKAQEAARQAEEQRKAQEAARQAGEQAQRADLMDALAKLWDHNTAEEECNANISVLQADNIESQRAKLTAEKEVAEARLRKLKVEKAKRKVLNYCEVQEHRNVLAWLVNMHPDLVCGAAVSLGYHHCNTPQRDALIDSDFEYNHYKQIADTIDYWVYTENTVAMGLDFVGGVTYSGKTWKRISCFWRILQNGTIIVTAPKGIAGQSGATHLEMKNCYLVEKTEDGVSLIPTERENIHVGLKHLRLEQPWVNNSSIALDWDLELLNKTHFESVNIGENISPGEFVLAQSTVNFPFEVDSFVVAEANRRFRIINETLCGTDTKGNIWLIKCPYNSFALPNVYGISKNAVTNSTGTLIIPETVEKLGYESIPVKCGELKEIIIESNHLDSLYAFKIINSEEKAERGQPFFKLSLPKEFDFDYATDFLIKAYAGKCYNCGNKLSRLSKKPCKKCGAMPIDIDRVNSTYLRKGFRDSYGNLNRL